MCDLSVHLIFLAVHLHWDLSCFIISKIDFEVLRLDFLCAVSLADCGSSLVPDVFGVTQTLPGKSSHITHFLRNEKPMHTQNQASLTPFSLLIELVTPEKRLFAI